MKNLAFYTKLAEDAIPLNDDDWGSERQIDASNLLGDELEQILSYDDFDDFELYANKATTEEFCAYALNILKTKYFGEIK
ncbi:MAG TPA: hypothetical protein EYQ14_07260 [Gammaproteobacteria bacterium]|nr:hypothetical protein [Gammaproteobacteria bacterium]